MASSPAVQVKDGAAAYVATTNGNNATPGNTQTIQLISQAGVSSWSISCIYTDELSSASAVTAALVIDNLNKVATFTAPVAGRAYIFQSRINGGVDVNGVAQPSYTTTFAVYTLTGAAARVICTGETTEGNPTAGWVAPINVLIRNPNAQPAALAGSQGIVQLAGDLAGNGTTAAAPLVSGITGNVAGYAQNSAPNGTQMTGNPKRPATEFTVNIVTATTAATTIFTFATTTSRKYSVRATIESLNAPVSAYSTWSIKATAVNNAGTLTMITASGGVTNEDNLGGFSLTFTAVGTSLVVTATDPLGGRRWTGTVYLAESAF